MNINAVYIKKGVSAQLYETLSGNGIEYSPLIFILLADGLCGILLSLFACFFEKKAASQPQKHPPAKINHTPLSKKDENFHRPREL